MMADRFRPSDTAAFYTPAPWGLASPERESDDAMGGMGLAGLLGPIIQAMQGAGGAIGGGLGSSPPLGAPPPMMTGGAGPSPTPQERNQRGPGYRLNPYEQDILGALNAGVAAGLDPQVASEMLMGTIQGAIGRRQENIATRQEGMAGLQEMAMQLASSAADPSAVASAVSGMAQSLPGMRGPRGDERTEGLVDYVYGMYPGGSEISGLAPYDYRQQYGAETGLPEEDRAALGQRVLALHQQGAPFKEIRDAVWQDAAAAGYDAGMSELAVQEAERIYEQVSGFGTEDIRGLGDYLRAQQGMPGSWEIPDAVGVNGPIEGADLYQQWLDAGGTRYEGDDFDITGLLGWMASSRPEMLQGWTEHWPSPVPYDPNGGGSLQPNQDVYRPGQGVWAQDLLETGANAMDWITGLLE